MLDVIIVIAYFLFMLFVGWRSRHQSADSYWVAERKYSTGRITMSLVATIFGASSTMGIIGLGYSRGMTGAWWALIGGLALVPFGLLLASRIRNLNVYTLPDILKRAYGEKVAVPAGIMISVAWCGVIAAQLIAGGRIVSGLFAIDFEVALMLVAAVFILYTFWGGQLTVIKTDSWQLSLFAGGLFVTLAFLFASQFKTPSLWADIPAGHWSFPASDSFGWYQVLVYYPLIVGLPYLVGPDIYSRVLCARDDRTAKRAALTAAGLVIPLAFLLAMFGLMARAHFPGIAAEAALPKTLTTLIPVGLKGLIVSGFLGAIMSSADTCLISASTILALNVIRPFFGTPQESNLRITRIAVLIIGSISWFIASRQQGIIASLLLGYTVFVGGVVIPTLGTFVQETLKITARGALCAVVVGGGFAIMGKIQEGVILKALLPDAGGAFLERILGSQYPSILPLVLSALVLLVVSRVTVPESISE